ncbi:hypothetical protein GmRootA79_11860 [Acidovorax sp. A79]|uniref:hypothetical protein n=1 Tax=Acidovorax sp. A79 TaxID=3056107 RepID=UPI0034E899DD
MKKILPSRSGCPQFIKKSVALQGNTYMESGWNRLAPSLSPRAVGMAVLQVVGTQVLDIRPYGEGDADAASRIVQHLYADLCK